MLKELYEKGYLNYADMILDNSRALGLKADEAFILIKILDGGNVSLPELASQVLMTSNRIDKILADLMDRGFYEIYLDYDNGVGKECLSFDPFFKKLEGLFNPQINFDEYDIEKTNKYLANQLNRVLTASELEVLQGLIIDDHYTYYQIVGVVDEIVKAKKVLTMKTITLNLANKKAEVKTKKEAPQALKDFFNRI